MPINVGDLDYASAGNLLTNIAGTVNRLVDGSGGIDSIGNPQMNYMWDVEFINPYLTSNVNNIRLYAQSSAIPSTQIEQIKRYYAGVEYTYKGRDMSPRTFRMSMFDNDDMEVYEFFDNWKRLMFNGEDKSSVSPNEYMFDIILNMKDATDSKITKTFRMARAFPFEIGEGALNYTESGLTMFDVTFAFQQMEVI